MMHGRLDGLPQQVVDAMFGLSDGPADRILLAAGRRIGELDPHRWEQIALAISTQSNEGLVGGLDGHERRRVAALARADGVDTRDRGRVLRWILAHRETVNGAVRHVAIRRGHVAEGADVLVRRWRGEGVR